MAENIYSIETRHFVIEPADNDDSGLKKWDVRLKKEEKSVGSVSFVNPIVHEEVQISVQLDKDYEKAGHYEEIYFSMASLIFQSFEVREIYAVCRHEDDKYVRGLERAGYILRQNKDGSDYFSIKKHKTVWTGAYLFIGLIAGFLMGIVLSNLWLGTIAGIVIGLVIGHIMDRNENSGDKVSKAFSDGGEK